MTDVVTIFELKEQRNHDNAIIIEFNHRDDLYEYIGDFTYEWLIDEAFKGLRYEDNVSHLVGVRIGEGKITPLVDMYAEGEYEDNYLNNWI